MCEIHSLILFNNYLLNVYKAYYRHYIPVDKDRQQARYVIITIIIDHMHVEMFVHGQWKEDKQSRDRECMLGSGGQERSHWEGSIWMNI